MDLIQRAAERIRERKASGEASAPASGGIPKPPRDGRHLRSLAEPAPVATAPAELDGNRRQSRQFDLDYGRLAAARCIVPNAPQSTLVEELRVIKRRLLDRAYHPTSPEERNLHVIMVTSAIPGEGKTFTTINLAISLTLERNLNVLLIDGDVHRQSLARTLGLGQQKGLLDLLRDPAMEPADVMLRTNVPQLTIMPAGMPDAVSPELMSSARMEALIEDMARRYSDRVILFDAPPCLASTEPTVLATHVGQVVCVVEAERTRRSEVEGALSLLRACPNIALVLNKCRIREPQQFGAYSYYYAP